MPNYLLKEIQIVLFLALATAAVASDTTYLQSGSIMARANKHVWLPTGNLARGGFHFGTTVQVGAESYKRGALYFGIEWRFTTRVNEEFFFINDGTMKTSNRYRGNAGAFIAYEHHTIKMNRWVLYPTIAIGTNSIAFTDDINIHSYSFSSGLGIKYFFLAGVPAYIQLKHTYLDFKNPNGSSFSGDSFSINSGFSLPIGTH